MKKKGSREERRGGGEGGRGKCEHNGRARAGKQVKNEELVFPLAFLIFFKGDIKQNKTSSHPHRCPVALQHGQKREGSYSSSSMTR